MAAAVLLCGYLKGGLNLKLYIKQIAPIVYYPGTSYEPKQRYVEDPVVWYPEDMREELWEKYKDLNVSWDFLGFEEKYTLYTDESNLIKSQQELIQHYKERGDRLLDNLKAVFEEGYEDA